jgi:hypothetical protein
VNHDDPFLGSSFLYPQKMEADVGPFFWAYIEAKAEKTSAPSVPAAQNPSVSVW